jgi:hypothetical protein
MHSLKKHARKEAAAGNEGFAALHLLHDPQVFFGRGGAVWRGGGSLDTGRSGVGAAAGNEGFAALHMLHDPQVRHGWEGRARKEAQA